jgi:RND family efflux transporter MFP subunit
MHTSGSTQIVDNPKRTTKAHTVRIVAGVLLLSGLIVVGVVPRLERHREALAAVRDTSTVHPVVSVIHPENAPPQSELALPGNIQPLYTAAVYARTDGYVERRNVDIGSKVHAGEVLAVISSPEVDQQLAQARANVVQAEAALQQAKANLEQTRANVELARVTKERYVALGKSDVVSRQSVDEAVQTYNARTADVSSAQANIAVAEANLKANQANVQRLVQLQSFEHVVAPFAGVITERNIERGDLVNSGSSGSKSLFGISQSNTLRIQVNVPQSQAVDILPGQQATLDIRERPGRKYTGTVVRSAHALDSAARTMLTEVQVDNQDGSLLPGMYAQVKFVLTRNRPALIIPSNALVVDKNGMHVVSVSMERIHFLPVEVGQDMGTKVEIVHGLSGNESLLSNPGDLLAEGQQVEVK